MREYRGKRVDNGEWVFGYYGELTDGDIVKSYIMKCSLLINTTKKYFFNDYEVIPESVGEFTGLKKIKRMVFTGDIVVHHRNEWSGKYTATGAKHYEKVSSVHEVYFDTEMLEFGLKNSSALFHCQFANEFEIIGNITDNPELLNE